MAKSINRLLAELLDNETGAVHEEYRDEISSRLTTYESLDSLPYTNLTTGDQAFVKSNQRMYISNGSGWYNVALVNASPSLSISPTGAITLASDGTPTVITLTGTDSDQVNLTFTVESDGDFGGLATLSQDSSVFTITPLSQDSATTTSSTLTFKTSDGINFGTGTSAFSLTFGPPQIKITASDAAASDTFGRYSSMSSDGNYIIVGTYASESAYIFVKSGSSWTQQTILTASDGEANDRFGSGVSISSDGSYAIVGAEQEDGGNGNPAGYAGAAYIFTRSGSTWTEQQKITASDAQTNDRFGSAVSISSDGSYAIVGAYLEDDGSGDPTSNAGAAYIFTRSGSTWTQQQRIDAPGASTNDFFGYRVGLNSNGTYALITAIQDYNGALVNAGAVYVFTRSGSTWTQQAKLTPSDASASDFFGRSVSLDSNANYAVATTSSNFRAEGGAAYIYTRSGSTWTQQTKITSSDGQTGDVFGTWAELNSDGTSLVVGAMREDGGSGDPTSNAGAAYVFTRSGSTWTEEYKLTASDAQVNDNFGGSVSISSDGSSVIVGAENEDGGAGDPLSNAGAVYVFDLS